MQTKNVDRTYRSTADYIEFSTPMYLWEFLALKKEIIKQLYKFHQYEPILATGKLILVEIFNEYKISNPSSNDLHSLIKQFISNIPLKEFSERLILHMGYANGYNVLRHEANLIKYLTIECVDVLVSLLKMENYGAAKKIIIAEQETARKLLNNIIVFASHPSK
jgi:hypothetical protein